MTYCDIDLHSNNMVIVALNGTAEVAGEAKLPTSNRSLADFFGLFSQQVQVAVDRAGNWYWLADGCRANGVELTLAHAKMFKAVSYAKGKTDKVDARTLAELLRADLIPEA